MATQVQTHVKLEDGHTTPTHPQGAEWYARCSCGWEAQPLKGVGLRYTNWQNHVFDCTGYEGS